MEIGSDENTMKNVAKIPMKATMKMGFLILEGNFHARPLHSRGNFDLYLIADIRVMSQHTIPMPTPVIPMVT
jgi:hypothetical protein